MAFVLDASIVACWFLDDENHIVADVALELLGAGSAVTPAPWWFEVRNMLLMSERRGRTTEAATTGFLRRLRTLAITVDRNPDEATVIRLARQHRLTFYDAAYLELAQRAEIALATLDKAMVRAAQAMDVRLVGQES